MWAWVRFHYSYLSRCRAQLPLGKNLQVSRQHQPSNWLVSHLIAYCTHSVPPSAASFYVSNLPGLENDPLRPLHVFAGHLLSDADAKPAPTTDVNAHLYFVLTKARRIADRERLIIWFNVRLAFRASHLMI